MGTKAIEPRIAGKARKTVESPRDHAVEQRERPLNVTDVRAEACQIEESFRIMEVCGHAVDGRNRLVALPLSCRAHRGKKVTHPARRLS